MLTSIWLRFPAQRKYAIEQNYFQCTSAAPQCFRVLTKVIPWSHLKVCWKLQDSSRLLCVSGLVDNSTYKWFSTWLSKRNEARSCVLLFRKHITLEWTSTYKKKHDLPSIRANLLLLSFFLSSFSVHHSIFNNVTDYPPRSRKQQEQEQLCLIVVLHWSI